MNVAILGCGPAGLLSAHAAQMCGHRVKIFSHKRKSPMQGAQYMHVEIPDINLSDPSIIKYVLWGDSDTYRQKVYGSGDPDIVVSPQQFQGEHKCWSLREAYQTLWDQWEQRITPLTITQGHLDSISQTNDAVISTIPADVLCRHVEHEFKYQPVWIDNQWSGPLPAEAPDLWPASRNLVICNGYPINVDDPEYTGWYRTSHIYAHTNTEWSAEGLVPGNRIGELGNVWRVRKPLSTNCTCWPLIVRAGRYGKWTKGVLTHHAFEETIRVLS
jgi:hypothetical protein